MTNYKPENHHKCLVAIRLGRLAVSSTLQFSFSFRTSAGFAGRDKQLKLHCPTTFLLTVFNLPILNHFMVDYNKNIMAAILLFFHLDFKFHNWYNHLLISTRRGYRMKGEESPPQQLGIDFWESRSALRRCSKGKGCPQWRLSSYSILLLSQREALHLSGPEYQLSIVKSIKTLPLQRSPNIPRASSFTKIGLIQYPF